MSENSSVVQKDTGRTVPRAVIVQMIAERFERLPELDRFFGTYLSSRYFDSYLKLLQLSTSSDEELEN
ncbi:unnamed protein product [Coregonus sp. 'balchen']|nr:unnamed protein product [Coregonus sp. 'balchen']